MKRFVVWMLAIVIFCSYILPDLNGIVRAIGLDFSFETKLESANIFSMALFKTSLCILVFSMSF